MNILQVGGPLLAATVSASCAMRVHVALLSGRSCSIEAEADWSIKEFRQRVQEIVQVVKLTMNL